MYAIGSCASLIVAADPLMAGREDTDEAHIPTGLSAALLSIAFAALTWWSWECWTQPLVDFGLELYVPWRLTEGEVLYRDIASRNGPLSHYVNALWFTLFGASLKTLVWLNLALAAAITVLVFRLIRRAFDPTAAFFATAAFLGVFGFSQYVGVANYNYVTPYQHGQTHGILLWLLSLFCIVRAPDSARFAFAAGFVAGLSFLTKVEVFLPTAACLVLGAWLLRLRLRPIGLGFATPVLVSLVLLSTAMPVGQALLGVAGNWAHLVQGAADQAFYATVMGTDKPLENLRESAQWFGLYVAVYVVGRLADGLADRWVTGRRTRAIGWFLGLGAGALLFWLTDPKSWRDLGRGLNFVALLAAPAFLWGARRKPGPEAALRALWAVGAAVLLVKMILHPRVYHYGFALGMPAGLLLVVLLIRGARSKASSPGPFSSPLGAGVVLAAIASLVSVTHEWYQMKTVVLGSGPDRMRAIEFDPMTEIAQQLVETLDKELAPGDSLLVLPEGTLINFLLKRENPSRYLLFLPPEFAAAGGDEVMVTDFERDPPDWVVLVPRDHREYGAGKFWESETNGAGIRRWFHEHYRGHTEMPVNASGQLYNAVLLVRK